MAVMSLPTDLPGGPDEPTAAVAKVRKHLTVTGDGRTKAKTLPASHLGREEKRDAECIDYPGDVDRPKMREHCGQMARPCPFVSCSHHLYLDVNPETGALKFNFPHLEVWEMAETCSLDVADRGGTTLEKVGAIYNLTHERIRQYEVRALSKIKKADRGDLGLPPQPESYAGRRGPHPGSP
jgi:hypothetical protein